MEGKHEAGFFVCKILGLGGNEITKEQWEKFEAKRSKPYKHKNPTLIHWVYGKRGEAQGMGYWTADYMMELIPEYVELFEFLLPKHVLLLNVDWSSNRAAMHPDAFTLTNMRVLFRGQRSVDGEDKPQAIPVFRYDYNLEEGNLGPNINKKWKDNIKVGETVSFKFEKGKAPLYAKKVAKASTWLGKAIGKRELAWRLGWWVSGMTEKLFKSKADLLHFAYSKVRQMRRPQARQRSGRLATLLHGKIRTKTKRSATFYTRWLRCLLGMMMRRVLLTCSH